VRDRGREGVGRCVGKEGERGREEKNNREKLSGKKGERWSRLVGMRKKMYMILWD
jgi:hypothetical protein